VIVSHSVGGAAGVRLAMIRAMHSKPVRVVGPLTYDKEQNTVYSALPDILRSPGAQEQIAADCRALVEQELSAKTGVSASALKVAHKVVTGFAPGYYQSMVESMVPDLLRRLQPFWADFHATGGGQFGDYLVKRGDEVAESVLGVTDDLAQRSQRGTIVKAYKAVREGAGRHVQAALPAVGALVEKHAA
jgi:hypothetical protein